MVFIGLSLFIYYFLHLLISDFKKNSEKGWGGDSLGKSGCCVSTRT